MSWRLSLDARNLTRAVQASRAPAKKVQFVAKEIIIQRIKPPRDLFGGHHFSEDRRPAGVLTRIRELARNLHRLLALR
ncbi:hypothetical protein [Methylocella silvestris]|uniref:hypothetical protein n=1 Tax=Methylocella silvestris TaxID=199596 RepID=UPI00059DD52F|nr:hypothetical protein [Methylocella silvestris]